jgi:hypothetical protein
MNPSSCPLGFGPCEEMFRIVNNHTQRVCVPLPGPNLEPTSRPGLQYRGHGFASLLPRSPSVAALLLRFHITCIPLPLAAVPNRTGKLIQGRDREAVPAGLNRCGKSVHLDPCWASVLADTHPFVA